MFHSSLPCPGPYNKTWHQKIFACAQKSQHLPVCTIHASKVKIGSLPMMHAPSRLKYRDGTMSSNLNGLTWSKKLIPSSYSRNNLHLITDRQRTNLNVIRLHLNCYGLMSSRFFLVPPRSDQRAPIMPQLSSKFCFEHVEKNNDLSSTNSTCSRL